MHAVKSIAERALLAGNMTHEIPSPCVSVCRMDAENAFCEGCLRSIDEIRRWGNSDDAAKKVIWALIAQRAAVVAPAPVAAP